MERPQLVADCIRAMMAESPVPVTVKCRIGVDEQNPCEVLPDFIARLRDAGLRHLVIHARKAWLKGLSPKENREIPPLDYPLVLQMKRDFADLTICLNGGVGSLDQVRELLVQGIDGVMVGRAAYHEPGNILIGADGLWDDAHAPDAFAVAEAMKPYIEAHLAQGGRIHQITRHMLGLFTGRPGARLWRRLLSEGASRPGAGVELLDQALAEVRSLAP
jgi:tRNA-dihydrouridine synthase A